MSDLDDDRKHEIAMATGQAAMAASDMMQNSDAIEIIEEILDLVERFAAICAAHDVSPTIVMSSVAGCVYGALARP